MDYKFALALSLPIAIGLAAIGSGAGHHLAGREY